MNEFENPSKPNISESVRTLVDDGSQAVDAIKNRVSGLTDSVSKNGAAAFDKAVSFIEANPLKAVGGALGLGYVAMRIVTSPLLKLGLLAGALYMGRNVIKK